jgi:hypothetical protein
VLSSARGPAHLCVARCLGWALTSGLPEDVPLLPYGRACAPPSAPTPIQIKDEHPVRLRTFICVIAKLACLPKLSLVLAEILNNEWSDIWNREQTLTGRMNGITAKVGSDPPPIQLLGNDCSRAGSADTVQNEVAFVG